jgi:hypothetical protein
MKSLTKMSQYEYSLEKYKNPASIGNCTNCGEKKMRFYVNNATGERLGDHVGKCERVDTCGYHYTPKMFFQDNPSNKPLDFEKFKPVPAPPPRPVSYIDKSIFEKTLGVNDTNTFTNFLIFQFGKERAENLINRYQIGTTKNAETIFYQVDYQGNVRSGKVMKYNLTASTSTSCGQDCKRDKSVNPNWVHAKLKLENFNLSQCLFGEHLLTDNQTVAIVESAKSAMIASLYFPQFVWVSCEGKEGLSLDKLKVLKNKSVILFPDLGGFEKWSVRAKEMTFCKSVKVSDLLEQVAIEDDRASGLDIADYLLRLPAPPAETLPAVETNISLGKIPQSNIPAVEEIVVLEEKPKPATPLTPLEIRGKLIAEWFGEHGKIFDGIFCLDGQGIERHTIVKHLQIIDNGDSVMEQSIKFLERIREVYTGPYKSKSE